MKMIARICETTLLACISVALVASSGCVDTVNIENKIQKIAEDTGSGEDGKLSDDTVADVAGDTGQTDTSVADTGPIDTFQPECSKADDCKDKVKDLGACEQATCNAGTCEKAAKAKDATCDDGDKCTDSDKCDAAGKCGGTAKDCSTGNPCKIGTCSKASGQCTESNADPGVKCDDKNKCTKDDACGGGDCVGDSVQCDDNNVCTDDSCNAAKGCVNAANSAQCVDGDECTTKDACKAGKCTGAKQDCDDKNLCTTDACDPKSGCSNKHNTEKCDDGNACTLTDTCAAGQCAGKKKDCDDNTACTTDACAAGKCTHKHKDGACDDGDKCTSGDKCTKGKCGGDKVDCDDNNVCTDDSCDAKTGCKKTNNTAKCSDGEPCTNEDTCKAGKCEGGKAPSCDDGNGCTKDSCEKGKGCKHTKLADAAKCDDGNGCTKEDKCGAGKCAGVGKQCDDGDPCTKNGCQANKCQFSKHTGACDDGNACTVGATCKTGKCVGKKKDCDDANPCTNDSCDAKTGCKYANNTDTCGDGDVCTGTKASPDVCKAGKCAPGAGVKCDDGNACTADVCVKAKGCESKAVKDGGTCSDGDACTEKDACKAGKCGGTTVNCDDNNVCTADSCDAKSGCKNTAVKDGAGCTDGNACTEKDACKSGACSAVSRICKDGNPCTDDGCDKKTGCTFTNNDKNACSDNTVCTGIKAAPDACKAGKCVPGKTLVCNDGKVCTTDTCDAKTGCKFTNIKTGTSCNDGNSCTVSDVCNGKGGCTGKGKNCDDKNPCTTDSCANDKCAYANNSGPCSDGSVCTQTDKCDGKGKCVGANPLPCDDKNVCTDDSCDAKIGCKKTPNTKPCSDGNKCTGKAGVDSCKAGKCVAGAAVTCPDDKNECTNEACDKVKGCVTTPNAKSCEDGSKCTKNDTCKAGKCAAGPKVDCGDGISCTVDGCDAKTGCTNKADAKQCDDANACTTDSCDGKNGCTKTNVADGTACSIGSVKGACKTGVCKSLAVDYDHDGLIGGADKCPTTWSPANGAVCPAWTGTGYGKSRALNVGQPDASGKTGASTWARSNEPVEIPLVNGILDSSVVGYWPLNGNGNDASAASNNTTSGSVKAIDGPLGKSTASTFDGSAGNVLKTPASSSLEINSKSYSFSLWMRHDKLTVATGGAAEQYPIGLRHSGGGLNIVLYALKNHLGKVAWSQDGCGHTTAAETKTRVDDGKWHNLVFVNDKGRSSIFVDGRLDVSVPLKECVIAPNKPVLTIGAGSATSDRRWKGDLSDLVVLRRVLTPSEIAIYANSKAPYGSHYAPGAQADFDDVRVTETTPWQKAHGTHQEIIGWRPHSDTDLKDVVAYWKLDGDGKDVVSGAGGIPKSTKPTLGRFGDPDGALAFAGNASVEIDTTKLSDQLLPAVGTIEAWFKTSTPCKSGIHQTIFNSPPAGGVGASLLVLESGNGENPCGIAFSSSSGMIWAPGKLAADRWYHVAVTWNGARSQLYLDGVLRGDSNGNISTKESPGKFAGSKPPIAQIGQSYNKYYLSGAIDEVIIHKVAKSADYLAKRARGLPRVRFFAATDAKKNSAGKFSYHGYKLRWGNPAAKALPTWVMSLDKKTKCDALLSSCLGYAGWWRLDDISGKWAIDETVYRHHATLKNAPERIAGRHLTGLRFKLAAKQELVIPSAKQFDFGAADRFSSEGSFSTTAGDAVILNTTGSSNVAKHLFASKVVYFQSRGAKNGGSASTIKSKANFNDGKWHHAAGVRHFAGDENALFVDGVEAGPRVTDKQPGGFAGVPYNSGMSDTDVDDLRIMHRALAADELLHYPLSSWHMPCSDGSCTPPTPPPPGDLDHDGLAGSQDDCPTVWSPANGAVCPAWTANGWASMDANIGAPDASGKPGASTARRTNEPVEIPLVNGISDSSVRHYLKFDGTPQDEITGAAATAGQAVGFAAGSTGLGQALNVDGLKKAPKLSTPILGTAKQFTMMMWFKAPKPSGADRPMVTFSYGGGNTWAIEHQPKNNKNPGVNPGLGVFAGHYNTKMYADAGAADTWHHVALVVDRDRIAMLYVDGKLAAQHVYSGNETWSFPNNTLYLGAYDPNKYTLATNQFGGLIDEFIVHSRMLSPTEIATYVHSKAPYGTRYTPKAQPDYDDLRVTETTPWQPAHGTHFELLGARPHSDTDLKDVAAYWKLDGDGKDVTGTHNGKVVGATAALGRFGDKSGALAFGGSKRVETGYAWTATATTAWTMEAWVWRKADATKTSFILGTETVGTEEVGFYASKSGLTLSLAAGGKGLYLTSGAFPNGRWVHVAVVRDAATKKGTLYIDGIARDTKADATQSFNATKKRPIWIGANNRSDNAATLFEGALDEVIIHKVAKSADYIAKRARGVPRVRFLAHTSPTASGGTYAFHKYKLHWGNAGAKALPIWVTALDKKTKCNALLSPCTGYYGWWRMNDVVSGRTPDASSWRRDAVLSPSGNEPALAGAGRGFGLNFGGKASSTRAYLPSSSAGVFKAGQAVTFESRSWANKASQFHMVSNDDGGAYNAGYNVGGGKILLQYESGPQNKIVGTSTCATASKWCAAAVAGSFAGGGKASVFKVFENGKEIASKWEGDKTKTPTQYAAKTLSFGNRSKPDLAFDGVIDTIRISNRALKADELLHYPRATWWLGKLPPTFTVIDDFNRADSATVGNGWVQAHGKVKIAGGKAVVHGGACSKHGGIGKDIVWRDKFDLRVTFNTTGAEPAFFLNSAKPQDGCGWGTTPKKGMGTDFGAGGIRLVVNNSVVKAATAKYPTNTDAHLRLRYDGTTLSAWMWKVGDAMPATPSVTHKTGPSDKNYGGYVVVSGDHIGSISFDDVIELPKP